MRSSHHVLDSCLEVSEEGCGLVSLHLSVLDGLSSQEVVHLDGEDGRRAALVLGAEIACAGGRAGHFPPSLTRSVDPLTQACSGVRGSTQAR